MARRPFEKYQGLGNDFVVVDAERWPEAMMNAALARALCDRHLGVGADGVLWVQRLHGFDGASPQGDRRAVRLVIWNADGTRPEMCGNGVRCVVVWLADQGTLLDGETVAVHTEAGARAATLHGHGAGAPRVAVEMGAIRLGDKEIVRVKGDDVAVQPVDVGNPHGVVFARVEDPAELVDAVRGLAAFPHGVNVEVVEALDGALRVRVHERGVGWTQACGTGACAVAAAAVRAGRARAGEEVRVRLDGGELSVRVSETPEGLTARMTGPAVKVFQGSW
ncbi:MAG: diaminopimelate epimerase [Polyangiales bacterium]